ncbi:MULTISPECIES: Imm52 family immunity protein [Xanthomonas translucens group]|uniref:Imm52 family immunity protein n=1 Tax=Xanthomonas translucens group TaxID=3390202 RepID=UPI001F2B780D|nr:Imm52 family immunity protein [Xanthomonas translucens]MCT8273336.1 immunity 52 family protein [Xanthomonas translucens pv. translucens]MCT8277520.1 immunity 52 family protein [Xanthomonas translucens pv. translucens]MCT8306287.1 immunity 52 family protein [Xanthomonas translucens pv. translucens]UKE70930.1 immunity 52 family protein [Xanthomonas translucens pv. pistacia]WNJ27793.1 Imm52 family immunity protein [Xanthomonas translucens pv. translucens]
MISAFIDASILVEELSIEEGFERLVSLSERLSSVHPTLTKWVEMMRKEDTAPMPLSDHSGYVGRIRRNIEQDALEFPGIPNPNAMESHLTTATSDEDWLKDGRASIDFWPGHGRITLEIYHPVEAFGPSETLRIVKQCVAAIGMTQPTTFIATDAHARLQNGEQGFDTYMGEHQLFPHRRWLGWMGFVPHMVEPRHIPEAAELIPVGRKGTVIVAVDECFDLHNPAHLKRAHEVEARMAHLGLLEVTDTSLLG